jgi:3-deoxy-D-manno-octulosonate 8-phosphate phosphatase (KDO 8-P phosphatase)
MEAGARARAVKMVLMDVDGTLTDGSFVILPESGEEVRAYNVRDGQGMMLAKAAGLKTGIITGKTSRSVAIRAERLMMDEVHQGVVDKKPVLDGILARHGLRPEEAAYVGDDLGDLEVMRSVGLAAAVADAHPLVRQAAHYVCALPGGRGAVREVIEFILEAKGLGPDLEILQKDRSRWKR